MVGANEANLGSKIFFIWGSLCFLCLIYSYFLVPETKGLTLETLLSGFHTALSLPTWVLPTRVQRVQRSLSTVNLRAPFKRLAGDWEVSRLIHLCDNDWGFRTSNGRNISRIRTCYLRI